MLYFQCKSLPDEVLEYLSLWEQFSILPDKAYLARLRSFFLLFQNYVADENKYFDHDITENKYCLFCGRRRWLLLDIG